MQSCNRGGPGYDDRMSVAFDTLQAARRLRDEGGFDEKQAGILVATFAEGISEGLASKADLEKTESALRSDLEKTESALRSDLEKTESALRSDLEKTESALRSDLEKTESALRSDLEKTESALRSDLEKTESALRSDLEKTESALRSEIGGAALRHGEARAAHDHPAGWNAGGRSWHRGCVAQASLRRRPVFREPLMHNAPVKRTCSVWRA